MNPLHNLGYIKSWFMQMIPNVAHDAHQPWYLWCNKVQGIVYVTMREFIDKENTLVGIHASGLLVNAEHSVKMGYYIRGSCILMRWLYDLDLGNGLDDIGIGSVYQHDTLTMPIAHVVM